MVDLHEIEEHSELVQKYLDEHQSELQAYRGLARWIARLRLELRAWKYANQETRNRTRDPNKPYLNR
jgi:hypothetical protein